MRACAFFLLLLIPLRRTCESVYLRRLSLQFMTDGGNIFISKCQPLEMRRGARCKILSLAAARRWAEKYLIAYLRCNYSQTGKVLFSRRGVGGAAVGGNLVYLRTTFIKLQQIEIDLTESSSGLR